MLKLPKSVFVGLGTFFAAVLVAEIWARFEGLGDPLLFVLDDEMEYYARPGAYERFGNAVSVNGYGMRSEEPAGNAGFFRVLLIGDSIVFGTSRVGQNELISSSLKLSLESKLQRPVEVLNIASPSWGPVNQEAFLRRHGWFNADAVIWVLSSHDLKDAPVPGYAETLPVRRPILALQDLYWIYRFRRQVHEVLGDPQELTLAAIARVLENADTAQFPIAVFHHPSISEIEFGVSQDGKTLMHFIKDKGISSNFLDVEMRKDADWKDYYLDELHLSSNGAKAIGEIISNSIMVGPAITQ